MVLRCIAPRGYEYSPSEAGRRRRCPSRAARPTVDQTVALGAATQHSSDLLRKRPTAGAQLGAEVKR